MDIALAMNELLPNAQWICRHDTYDTLEMLDATPKPLLTDLEQAWNVVLNKQAADKAAQDANKARDDAMLLGFTYNLNGTNYQCSVTKDDGDGMMQVKIAFDMGLTSTNIHFVNGTVMPINTTDFGAFALAFITERNKYFV
jgi:hypothetical protein